MSAHVLVDQTTHETMRDKLATTTEILATMLQL